MYASLRPEEQSVQRNHPANYLFASRALRDFGDGFVAVLLPAYLLALGAALALALWPGHDPEIVEHVHEDLAPDHPHVHGAKSTERGFRHAHALVIAAPAVSIDEQMARDLIAKRIVAAARDDGERDLERLKRYALQAFET